MKGKVKNNSLLTNMYFSIFFFFTTFQLSRLYKNVGISLQTVLIALTLFLK